MCFTRAIARRSAGDRDAVEAPDGEGLDVGAAVNLPLEAAAAGARACEDIPRLAAARALPRPPSHKTGTPAQIYKFVKRPGQHGQTPLPGMDPQTARAAAADAVARKSGSKEDSARCVSITPPVDKLEQDLARRAQSTYSRQFAKHRPKVPPRTGASAPPLLPG